MIANFSELLRRDIRKLHIQDEQQLAQIGEWLSYTTDGATRLVRLVDDLLAYSRVKTGTMAFRQVDMNSALEVAKRNLQTILKDYPTAITAGDLPPAGGDAALITQIFQNLLSNALKFMPDSREPVIVITGEPSETEPGNIVYSCQDNGIGIEPKHFKKIFEIFHRLHRRKDYDGSGVGLAFCHRVVTLHGGRIWVESNFGEGSTFRFTLPDHVLSENERAEIRFHVNSTDLA